MSASPGIDDVALQALVAQAVDLSTAEVARGGIPFAALVVDPLSGEVLGEGVNRVAEQHDALAHAEIVALQDAARRRGAYALPGSLLIASGEPCGLCYHAALQFRVGHVVYAASADDAARYGFDYRGSYSLFRSAPRQWWPGGVRAVAVDGALAPFDLFANHDAARLERQEKNPR